jgi:prephenate dehydratase/prephenate dehydrogenase
MGERYATLPKGTYSYTATESHIAVGGADIVTFETIDDVVDALEEGKVDKAIVPIYNTHDKKIHESLDRIANLKKGLFIIDNVVMPIEHAIGCLEPRHEIKVLVSKDTVFRQCHTYIKEHYRNASHQSVSSTAEGIEYILSKGAKDIAVIASKNAIRGRGLIVIAENVVPYNRTRFAVLGKTIAERTGCDATLVVTYPLKDKTGLLCDILLEMKKRDINLKDLSSDTEVQTQKPFFYIELEGHIKDERVKNALESIEKEVIREEGSVRFLGSYPRVSILEKNVKSILFIGTGPMNIGLESLMKSEGYETYLCGRSTTTKPEDVIDKVDTVICCVPMRVAPEVIKKYLPMMHEGQAFIDMSGEKSETIMTAIEYAKPGVEVTGIHELRGPNVPLRGKNVIVVKTDSSREKSQEMVDIFYKHGATITYDSKEEHDHYVGYTQKEIHAILIAVADVLRKNRVGRAKLEKYSTPVSELMFEAMARVHYVNPPSTYGDIQVTNKQGDAIISSFIESLTKLNTMNVSGDYEGVIDMIKKNRKYLGKSFLKKFMEKSKKVSEE